MSICARSPSLSSPDDGAMPYASQIMVWRSSVIKGQSTTAGEGATNNQWYPLPQMRSAWTVISQTWRILLAELRATSAASAALVAGGGTHPLPPLIISKTDISIKLKMVVSHINLLS